VIAPEILRGDRILPAVQPAIDEKPFMFITVGTDHHPFDRLVRWVDDWFLDGGLLRARGLIQVGTSRPPRSVEWTDYLRADEMQATLDLASVVVCHGGPSTVMRSRRIGFRPIVVPRRQELGEHVDDHQVQFSRWLDRDQDVTVVGNDEGSFRDLLEHVVADRDAFRGAAALPDVRASALRFEGLIDELFTERVAS
jgi:UDP-N-acetylglucosamine transferase subunit ALG13